MMAASERIQEAREAIARKKEELTVPEKIILHLGMYRRQFDVFDMSMMLTQDGIAYAAGVKRAHASVELKKLLRRGISMDPIDIPFPQNKRRKGSEDQSRHGEVDDNLTELDVVLGLNDCDHYRSDTIVS